MTAGNYDLDRAVGEIARLGAEVLVARGDPLFTSNSERIGRLALKYGLPSMGEYREFPAGGGLLSYGPSNRGAIRQAAELVDRILRGARPADLPVVQPAKFELVINLRTAKSLGITIPQSFLLRADEVIQ